MAASIIALAVPCSLIAAIRPRPIHPERLKMSPAARREAVLTDLNAILTGPAAPDTVATRPYLSQMGGLCRRDVIRLAYATAEGRDHWTAPLEIKGVDGLYPQYRLLGEEDALSRADWAKACARLSGDKEPWVTGNDVSDNRAYEALTTLGIALEAARKNQAITFDCTELEDASQKVDCRAEFIAAATAVIGFGSCDGRQAYYCHAFFSQKYPFDVLYDSSAIKRSITIRMGIPDIVVT
jgi:hypothetical protein